MANNQVPQTSVRHTKDLGGFTGGSWTRSYGGRVVDNDFRVLVDVSRVKDG